jgi:ABC-type ATPase with predicted acetyltransferase domain
MATYNISKSFPWQGVITDKTAAVMKMFGLTTDRVAEASVAHKCQLEINDGDIVYISGPSGAGKSVLLSEFEKAIPAAESINLERIELPRDRTVIDCMDGDVLTGIRTLSIAGLSDCLCVLNRPANLGDGQKYRFRLAVALAARKKFVFADEFCSSLDRVTAAVISHNVRKFASRTATTFILAASQEDILCDLLPDVLVVKDLAGPAEVFYKRLRR